MEQLVSLPWKAVVLRYFEEEMRTAPRIHALMAVPYVRTEMQLRFAWCLMGLTREEYDSEERKRSKEEKVFLMTNLRDLIIQEGAAVACAKRRDALCFRYLNWQSRSDSIYILSKWYVYIIGNCLGWVKSFCKAFREPPGDFFDIMYRLRAKLQAFVYFL